MLLPDSCCDKWQPAYGRRVRYSSVPSEFFSNLAVENDVFWWYVLIADSPTANTDDNGERADKVLFLIRGLTGAGHAM